MCQANALNRGDLDKDVAAEAADRKGLLISFLALALSVPALIGA